MYIYIYIVYILGQGVLDHAPREGPGPPLAVRLALRVFGDAEVVPVLPQAQRGQWVGLGGIPSLRRRRPHEARPRRGRRGRRQPHEVGAVQCEVREGLRADGRQHHDRPDRPRIRRPGYSARRRQRRRLGLHARVASLASQRRSGRGRRRRGGERRRRGGRQRRGGGHERRGVPDDLPLAGRRAAGRRLGRCLGALRGVCRDGRRGAWGERPPGGGERGVRRHEGHHGGRVVQELPAVAEQPPAAAVARLRVAEPPGEEEGLQVYRCCLFNLLMLVLFVVLFYIFVCDISLYSRFV